VGRTDVGSGKQIPRRKIAEFGQRSDDVSTSVNNDGRDVFQEDDVGSNVANDSRDAGPQPTLIFCSQPGAGDREGLTGETGSEAMNESTPASAIEVVKVVPDRRLTKLAFFHSRDQISDDKGFPLHVTHGVVGISEDKLQSKLESPDAGT